MSDGGNMVSMRKIVDLIDNISEWTGRVFCWTVIVLNIIVVVEVIMRRFFNHPTVCNFEITKQIYGFHFMIVAAYALLHGSHVSIDIIHVKLNERKQAILDVVSYIMFFFPFTLIVLLNGIRLAAVSWSQSERVWSVCASPLYPIKTVIPVTAFLLLIQGIAIFIRRVQVLIK
jgi:TRAP-type mannitol/chloroaromatic compound transport system permease small subunit